MSILASLAFVLAAVAVVGALRSTVIQCADAALGNLAAVRQCGDAREFRISLATVTARSGSASVRRIAPRKSPLVVLKPVASGLRAAA
jgi:hypothetical protein